MSRGNEFIQLSRQIWNRSFLVPAMIYNRNKDCIVQFRSNVNGSRKPSFIELEMPMNLDDKFESYLISAHSDWDQTFITK